MDRGAWQATVHSFPQSRIRLRQQHAHMHKDLKRQTKDYNVLRKKLNQVPVI